MNQYLVALIGLIVIFVVGAVVYGALFKDAVKGSSVKLTATRFVVAAIGMYLIALAFTVLFNDVSFANGATGITKGLYLGLLVGIPFLAIPLYADSPYFKADNSTLWAVIANWVVALAVLGIVVGALVG